MAGLMMVVGTAGAQQAVAAGWSEAQPLGPVKALVKAKPGGTSRGFALRLPDGRILRFSYVPGYGAGHAPVPGAGAHRPPHRPPDQDPSSGDPGTGAPPSGNPTDTGSPSASDSPSVDPSLSGMPMPVVGSLFPSPASSSGSADGGHAPDARPGHGAAGAPRPSVTPARSAQSDPAQDGAGAGADAVVPGVAAPERPASTVPPPLGPQALLHPGAATEQIATRNTASGGLGPRARLLGVGLALIGAGAALFGWRIRRL
ncbi:hypothetical protein [Streptacidiphilus anmyonensis]|uniref:hypothetical protein n=1 Tax=Streptacidiphilus anmyonensis TaxID=405782 RepID=UPI0005A865FA|nr:hypothetical protein [Streptacidiphilus anmyonensis]